MRMPRNSSFLTMASVSPMSRDRRERWSTTRATNCSGEGCALVIDRGREAVKDLEADPGGEDKKPAPSARRLTASRRDVGGESSRRGSHRMPRICGGKKMGNHPRCGAWTLGCRASRRLRAAR